MPKTLIILMVKCSGKVSQSLNQSLGPTGPNSEVKQTPLREKKNIRNLQSDMGGIFGFFLGVSMVSVVHSVQKFYDRVMSRFGIHESSTDFNVIYCI